MPGSMALITRGSGLHEFALLPSPQAQVLVVVMLAGGGAGAAASQPSISIWKRFRTRSEGAGCKLAAFTPDHF